jgi:hypothetical protein
MRSDTLAGALEANFESIRRDELARLRKKVNGLSPEGQAIVEAATLAIVAALATRCATLGHEDPEMLRTVSDLFVVQGEPADRRRAPAAGFLVTAATTS